MRIARAAIILGVMLAVSSLSAQAEPDDERRGAPHLEVPLYSDSGSLWSRVVKAAPTSSMIFLNPSDGPGNSAQSQYIPLVRDARARGIRVLGYVATAWANGTVSTSEAEAAVSKYYSWYGVDGIIFDEVNDTCTLAPVTYYTELYNFVKEQSGADLVVLNPGTSVGACYAGISDVLITFEDTYASFLTYQEPDWVWSYPGDHFLNIVLDAHTKTEMQKAINLAISRNANGVYVTNLGANGTNPYSSLPSYFDFEVAYLRTHSHHCHDDLTPVSRLSSQLPRALEHDSPCHRSDKVGLWISEMRKLPSVMDLFPEELVGLLPPR